MDQSTNNGTDSTPPLKAESSSPLTTTTTTMADECKMKPPIEAATGSSGADASIPAAMDAESSAAAQDTAAANAHDKQMDPSLNVDDRADTDTDTPDFCSSTGKADDEVPASKMDQPVPPLSAAAAAAAAAASDQTANSSIGRSSSTVAGTPANKVEGESSTLSSDTSGRSDSATKRYDPNCAVPGCTKKRQGKAFNNMCKAHFRESKEKKCSADDLALSVPGASGGSGGDDALAMVEAAATAAAATATADSNTAGSMMASSPPKAYHRTDTDTPDLCSTGKATPPLAGNEVPATGKPSAKRRIQPRPRTPTQCGKCDACMIDDCGECIYCLDMPQFGGKWKRKQKCKNRPPCVDRSAKPPPPVEKDTSATRKKAAAPDTSRRSTPKEVSDLIDDKSLQTKTRLRKRKASSSPPPPPFPNQSASSATVPVRSSARNKARKQQRVEEGQAKQIRIESATSGGGNAKSPPNKSAKTGTISSSKKNQANSGGNVDVTATDGGWRCSRCSRMNLLEKKRCSACKGWKGGVRQKTPPPDPLSSTTSAAAAASAVPAPAASSSREQKDPNSLVVMAKVGGKASWSKEKEATLPRATSLVQPGSVELDKLEEADELPTFPQTGCCEWSFDGTSRVLLAKFNFKRGSNGGTMHPADQEFLLQMMERDDVAVISEGLVDDLDPTIWDLQFISDLAGGEYCHRVRQFTRHVVEESKLSEGGVTGGGELAGDSKRYFVTHKEEDGGISMKLSDYIIYLDKRPAALERIAAMRNKNGSHPVNPKTPDDDLVGRQCQDEADPSEKFTFSSHDGTKRSVNVVDDVLYLIDYDMVKLLPALYDDLRDKFKLPDCLPGGKHCMMNAVNIGGRPFMGPNLYVTPPASFTHFHQDGHGTVDSGHLCLSGYNEVVMLRRMPEEHKQRALHILKGQGERNGKAQASPSSYDALYGMPHGDNLGEKPLWPSRSAIQECRDMNYYPSVFILKPGQFVHIGKGRLHAFRKMSPTTLPAFDCHSAMRSRLIAENDGSKEQICVSVAWDWMFQGVTSKGINREIVSTLECARLNRKHFTQSLAIPETSILHMARRFVSEHERKTSAIDQSRKHPPILSFRTSSRSLVRGEDPVKPCSFAPSTLEVLKGIMPSLSYVVNRHQMAYNSATQMKDAKDSKLSIAPRPNACEDPEAPGIDPYDNDDFMCKICGEELSNCYMHCNGCEELLSKDFNICVSCHSEGKHSCFVPMHPFNKRRNTAINHVGNMKYGRRGNQCPCANGPVCKKCKYCAGCSCRCHNRFTMHLRFMSIEDEVALLKRVEAAVGDDALPPDPTLTMLAAEKNMGKEGEEEEAQGKKIAAVSVS